MVRKVRVLVKTYSRALKLVAAVLIAILMVTSTIITYFYCHYSKIVDQRLASGYLTSRGGMYAAPRVLRPRQRVTPESLADSLRRAGYVSADESAVWNGRFNVAASTVEIFPRRSVAQREGPPYEAIRVSIDRSGRIEEITGDGLPLDSYELEPEPLTNDAGVKTDEHQTLSYRDIPPVLVHAILSIEDRRFFDHDGLDPVSIVRAALSWGHEEQDFKQGGSTITQQLVKNTYLSHERTLRRKFHEAILASVIERRMSKEDIFALYCNEIYLGQRRSVGVRGVQQAARVFFGKELKDLTLAEAATVAGMIQSPGRYAPDRRPELARIRRNTVLGTMVRDHWITREQAEMAARDPVRVAPAPDSHTTAPYFIDYVDRIVTDQTASIESANQSSLRVYTTIDLELQQLAEKAVRKQLERLDRVFKGERKPQAALIALEPRSGRVVAMVGGSSYAESQLNRATDAQRQPGSVFKPIVYAAAMENGISPLTLSLDAPREFTYDYRSRYRPANYGGGYTNHDVTLRTGLIRSLNVVTVDVGMRTGLERVANLAGRMGMSEPQPYPAITLGASEATPLQIAGAYTAFANGGRVRAPQVIARVDSGVDSAGMPPDASEGEGEQVLKPSTAYMMTDMMMEVINRGTARAARGMVKGSVVAGKTGTSRDGWFAGYTPNLVCVVWVGFDDGSQLGLTGAESALPIWTEFVAGAVDHRPELGGARFLRPESITFVEIDPETGALAARTCPHRERVALTPALVPVTECFTHGAALVIEAALGGEAPETSERTSAEKARSTRESVRPNSHPSIQVERALQVTEVEINNGRSRLTNALELPTMNH